MRLEVIEAGGLRFAECLRRGAGGGTSGFVSPPGAGFQLGTMARPAGYAEPPHWHRPIANVTLPLSEFIFVQSGCVTFEFFAADGARVAEVRLAAGDAIVLIDGVHAYRADTDFAAIVVKQGPFQHGADRVTVAP